MDPGRFGDSMSRCLDIEDMCQLQNDRHDEALLLSSANGHIDSARGLNRLSSLNK